MPRKLISVSFACLDEHGRFTGYAEMAFALSLDITCQVAGRGAKFTVLERERSIKLHRGRYSYVGLKTCVGSMFWASFAMRRGEARRLLRDMARSGHWDCEGGYARMCQWWDHHAGDERMR